LKSVKETLLVSFRIILSWLYIADNLDKSGQCVKLVIGCRIIGLRKTISTSIVEL